MRTGPVLSLFGLITIILVQSKVAIGVEHNVLASNADLTASKAKEKSNNAINTRFIPVELFTGAPWNGKHELSLKPINTSACAKVVGRNKPCDNYYITGPFETDENNSQIKWAGEHVSYYRRVYSTPRSGEVESFFTINNSKDGLVRIYDKRKQWGARTYNGLGSKFPLGYWKQGEVRVYPSRRPTRIEIIELDDPDHCLTFRWTIGQGKKRNQDNLYTFCPNQGFTKFSHYNADGKT